MVEVVVENKMTLMLNFIKSIKEDLEKNVVSLNLFALRR